MLKVKIVIYLFVAFILSGCAYTIQSINVKIDVPDDGSVVYVNGLERDTEESVTLDKHVPFVVTTYRNGFRAKSMFMDDVHPDLGLLVDFAAIGIGVKAQSYETVLLASIATVVDLASSGGRVKRYYEIPVMDSLFQNKLEGFNLYPSNSLKYLVYDTLYQESYKTYLQFTQKKSNFTWDKVVKIQSTGIDTYEWAGWNLMSMNLQAMPPSVISSFDKNLYLDLDIPTITVTQIEKIACQAEGVFKFSFCDQYGNRLDSITVAGSSQVFYKHDEKCDEAVLDALYDALIKALSSEEFEQVSKGIQSKYESIYANREELVIPAPAIAQTNTSEFLNAQVTIEVIENSEPKYYTGCMISNEGHLLTSYKIAGNMQTISVIFANGQKKKGTVMRKDAVTNTALYKVDTLGNAAISVQPIADYKVGDDIYILETPDELFLSQTISSGIVSSIKQTNGIDYIQTDATISGYETGCPMINTDGKLIGLVNERLSIFISDGIAFAVSSTDIMKRLNLRYTN
jgi:Trypsin-like peptidase domain